MLCAMAGSRDVYVDGLRLGFRLLPPSESDAVEKLAAFFQRRPAVRVFKTHDVGAKDFDSVCAAIPELRVLTLQRDFRDVLVSRYFYTDAHQDLKKPLKHRGAEDTEEHRRMESSSGLLPLCIFVSSVPSCLSQKVKFMMRGSINQGCPGLASESSPVTSGKKERNCVSFNAGHCSHP